MIIHLNENPLKYIYDHLIQEKHEYFTRLVVTKSCLSYGLSGSQKRYEETDKKYMSLCLVIEKCDEMFKANGDTFEGLTVECEYKKHKLGDKNAGQVTFEFEHTEDVSWIL